MSESKIASWEEYVEKFREKVEKDHPGLPVAALARMLVSGWRAECQRAGRAETYPAEDNADDARDAAAWRARALAEAQRAKAHGGSGSSFSTEEMAVAYLALVGRGPTGRRFFVGGGR